MANRLPRATLAAFWGISLFAPSIGAQSQAVVSPGSYRCSAFNASGGGGSCRTMPPLVINANGTYQYSSTRGRWTAHADTIVLSESKVWGPGTILGSGAIRFQYDYRGWHYVVTWTCQECANPASSAPAGAKNARAAAGGGPPTGLALTLDFGKDISGFNGFTIVPAELAKGYIHDGPLPQGAVQGLAWNTSRTVVTLQTSRMNKVVSGRQYVVFLEWPREAVAVAVLDVPATSGDYYTAKLPATLEGDSVLAKVHR